MFGGSFASPTPAFGGGASAFGSQQNKFGAPSTPTFGGAQTGGGSTFGGGFGSTPATPRAGSTGGFGSFGSQPTAGGFGAKPAAFGSPSPGGFGQPSTPTFGGGQTQPSAFGAPQQSGAFGARSTSPFGSQPTTGGFGQQQASSPFGKSNATPAFGQPAGGAFGQQPAATGAFGHPAAGTNTGGFGQSTTGAFGQQQKPFGAASSPFGATTSGFGSTAPAFGAGGQMGGGGGSAGKFRPTVEQQTVNNVQSLLAFESITASQDYKNMSFEEIRFNDMKGGGSSQPQQGGFGGFGQQQQSTPAFGSPAAGQSGAFGQPAAVGAFGQPAAVGAFGQPAAGGAFGQKPATGGFGSPAGGAFGQPAAGGTFGQPATGGAFGQPAASGAFGQPAAGGAFGQSTGGAFGQKPATGGFGSPATGAFGQPAASGGFGQPAASGAFGQSTGGAFGQKPATGGFGSPAGGAFGQPAAGGAFGQPAAGGAFGQSAAGGAFGQSTGGAFGQKPATGGFGSPATGAFGQPAAGGGFGQPAASGAFGQSAGGGAFGQPATGGAFGQSAAGGAFGQSTGGAFGQKPATGGFGSPAGGAFGQPATGGAFGQSSTSGGFGSTSGGAFGQSTSAGGSFGFGQQKPAAGGFGSPATTGGGSFNFGGGATATQGGSGFNFGSTGAGGTGAFGSQNKGGFGSPSLGTGTGGFGQSSGAGGAFGQPATGGAFGQKPATGGFGSPAGAFGQSSGGGAFGQGTSTFNLTGGSPGMGGMGSFGMQGGMTGYGNSMSGMPQQGIMERQAKASIKWLKQQEDSVSGGNTSSNPDGSSTPGSGNTSGSSSLNLGTAAHVPSSLLPSGSLVRSSVGLSSGSAMGMSGSLSGNGLSSPFGTRIRPRGLVSEVGKSTTPAKTPNHRKPLVISRRATPKAITNGDENSGLNIIGDNFEPSARLISDSDDVLSSPLPKLDLSSPNSKQSNKALRLNHHNEEKRDHDSSNITRPIAIKSPNQETHYSGNASLNSEAPKLSNPHYATSPPMSELKTWPTSELKRVKGFKITKYHPLTGEAVGSICWDGEIDISNVNLERDVVIVNEVSDMGKHKWFATVYESVSGSNEYPEQGSKLNNPSVVTFHGVFCKSRKPEKLEAYPDKLAGLVASVGGTFLSYEQKSGTVSFRVPHWSRYEIEEDSDSEDSDEGFTDRSPMKGRRQPRVSGMSSDKIHDKSMDMMMSSSSEDESENQTGGIQNISARKWVDDRVDDSPQFKEPSTPHSPWPPQTPQGFTSPFSQPLSSLSAHFYGSSGYDQPSPFQSPFAKQPQRSFQQISNQTENNQEYKDEGNTALALVPNRNEVFQREDEVGSPMNEGQLAEVNDTIPDWYAQPLGLPPKEDIPLPQVPRFYRANDERCATQRIFERALNNLQQSGRLPGAELKRSTHMSLDVGLTMGKSFRASFGPNGQLVLPFSFNANGLKSHQTMMLNQTSSSSLVITGGLSNDNTSSTDVFGNQHAVSVVAPHLIHASEAIRSSKTFLQTLECMRAASIHEKVSSSNSLELDDMIIDNDNDTDKKLSEVKTYHETRQFRLPRAVTANGKKMNVEEYTKLAQFIQQCCDITSTNAKLMTSGDMEKTRSSEWSTSQMWLLSRALWGQEPVNSGRAGSVGKNILPLKARTSSYQYRKDDEKATCLKHESKRLNMIQHWLKVAVKGSSDSNLPEATRWRQGGNSQGENKALGQVIDMLSEGRHAEASRVAIKVAQSPRLALMIAGMGGHGGGSREICYYIQEQLRNWHTNGASKFIPLEVRLAYTILSGDSFLLNPDSGFDCQNGDGSNYDDRSCMSYEELKSMGRDLDWLRRLGLSLWYHTQPFPCIRTAFNEYNHAVTNGFAHAPTPQVQKYCNDGVGEKHAQQHRCVLHHMLDLYCRSEDEPSSDVILNALTPGAVTDDVLDLRHSFQLGSLLRALGLYDMPSIGVHTRICDSLATQLIAANKWEWACFIYLTLDDKSLRDTKIRELVLRHAHDGYDGFTLSDGSKVSRHEFLCGHGKFSLGLPEELLFESLAYWTNYGGSAINANPEAASSRNLVTKPFSADTFQFQFQASENNVEHAQDEEMHFASAVGISHSLSNTRMTSVNDCYHELSLLGKAGQSLRAESCLASKWLPLQALVSVQEQHNFLQQCLSIIYPDQQQTSFKNNFLDAYFHVLDIMLNFGAYEQRDDHTVEFSSSELSKLLDRLLASLTRGRFSVEFKGEQGLCCDLYCGGIGVRDQELEEVFRQDLISYVLQAKESIKAASTAESANYKQKKATNFKQLASWVGMMKSMEENPIPSTDRRKILADATRSFIGAL